MALIIKSTPSTPPSSTTRRWRSSSRASVKSSSKGGGRTTNPTPKGCATNVVSSIILSLSDRDNDKKGRKKEKKKYYKKKGDDAHVCREWDSDMSSTDSSSEEDAANITVKKGLLFPNVGLKCLMAKDGKRKKVKSRASTKYTISSDEGSSSEDEDNLLTFFANLNMQQKEKLNELIGVIHEKDELLDNQEEFLIKENKKHVKLKNAYAQEVEKCENLSKELRVCHESISNLRIENANLFTKVEKLNTCDDSITNLKNDNAV
jgi:hypothetical protein